MSFSQIFYWKREPINGYIGNFRLAMIQCGEDKDRTLESITFS